jgi:nicotinamidase-related amidase
MARTSKTSNTGRKGHKAALLILDMLSEYRFRGADKVLRHSRAPARAIARLKERMGATVPVIYVNDTGGAWESDQREFVKRCCRDDAKGSDVSQLLAPEDGDYFMFKPQHSGFYGTPLLALLNKLRVQQLILTGMTAHQCVLFTAVDAYVREFELIIPPDCLGGGTAEETRHALFIFKNALKARVVASKNLKA